LTRKAAFSLPGAVVGGTVVAVIAAGLSVVWLSGGRAEWFSAFFDLPGTLIVTALNLTGLILCLVARRQFLSGEPLRLVWTLAAIAASCNLIGGFLSQVVAVASRFTLLGGQFRWSGEGWLRLGSLIAGPVQTALLVAALTVAFLLYRRSNILVRPRPSDWVWIGLAVGFCLVEAATFLPWGRNVAPTFRQQINLINDPLLGLLLVEAVLVRRSALALGRGLIARCWGAFTLAIMITFAGDFVEWIVVHSPIVPPLAATAWYLWFMASAAYALAPAYQIEACRRAGRPNPASAGSGVTARSASAGE
jgi:hypothetical protein